MPWTSALDLHAQTQKLWDKGTLLSELVNQWVNGKSESPGSFPRRLRLQSPATSELSARFEDARIWAEGLRLGSRHYRLVERDVRSPVLGSNRIPDEAWLDTLQDALTLISKTKDAARFAELVRITKIQQPTLLPWLEKRPHVALELNEVWQRLLNVVGWLQAHRHPGIYLRQVDIVGVDSKFIESHRSVLADLFDLALPPEAIDRAATGASRFCQRYGFLDKPLRIRFRLLESSVTGYGEDVTVTQTVFEQLNTSVSHVFITENEVNFLAFPDTPNALVVFGGGWRP